MANYAIILAGGIGSRFWPLSTEIEPKQFLNLCSDKTMLEQTVERISPLISRENIYLAVNQRHKHRISRLANRLAIPAGNILLEPESRNTFPAIAVLSQRINRVDKGAVISVLPCDHVINNNKRFRELLSEAIEVCSRDGTEAVPYSRGYPAKAGSRNEQRNIVTFGIRPKRPETGYGYIKINAKCKMQNAKFKNLPTTKSRSRQNAGEKSKLYKIEKFVEKPDLRKAKRFVKDKRYYWNSGIFVFKSSVMLEEIKKIMPKVFRLINDQPGNTFPIGHPEEPRRRRGDEGSHLASLWSKLPATSIDYAIMEKTTNLALLPADYGWIDLGSWQAIEEISKKDKQNNIFRGNCVDSDSKNTTVWADNNQLVATIGLRNIIIVQTKHALLVCAKDRTQDVKKIMYKLKSINQQAVSSQQSAVSRK